MGFLSDFLFGKDPQQNNQQLPTLSPQQQALLSQLISQGSGSPDVTGAFNTSAPYKGDLTTELSPLQGTSLAALEEAAMQRVRGPTSAQTTASNTVKNAQNVDPTQLAGEFDKMFQTSVQDPLIKDFTRTVVPELSRRYSGSSVFSTDRRAAEADASGRLAEQLAGARSSGFFNYLNDARTRALSAAGMSGAVEGAPIDQLTSLLSAGGVPTALKQQNLQALYAEFLRQNQAKQSGLQNVMALLGIKPFENVVTQTPGTPGFLTAAAPGAGAAFTKWALAA